MAYQTFKNIALELKEKRREIDLTSWYDERREERLIWREEKRDWFDPVDMMREDDDLARCFF